MLLEITLFGCALYRLMHQSFVTMAAPGNGSDFDFPSAVLCYDTTLWGQ